MSWFRALGRAVQTLNDNKGAIAAETEYARLNRIQDPTYGDIAERALVRQAVEKLH